LALLAAISSLALSDCSGSKNAYVPPPPPKVVVAQPVQEPLTLYLTLTGNTSPFRTVTLVARVQGYLESINYKDGATVTGGMQLFGIERDTYQATLDENKGQLAHDEGVLAEAQVDLARYQKLQQEKSISGQQAEDQVFIVQQDKATVEVDKANIETANINLGFTSVLAPFDGIVTNHQADLGALLSSSGSTTLATIIQSSPLYANFTLSEPQIIELQKSSAKAGHLFATTDLTYLSSIPVEVGMQGEEGYPHKGHLDYASPQVTTATGTLTVRALFDNKDQALMPGLFVRVRLPIGRREKALLTQSSAIGTSQEGSYVLVVGDDNVVQRRIVKTGQQEGQLQVIESGLGPSDWVVIEGVQRAIPGAKVAPQQSKVAVAANPLDPLAQ